MDDILVDVINNAKKRCLEGVNPNEIIDISMGNRIVTNVVRNCLYHDIPLKILQKIYPMFSPINEHGIKIKDIEREIEGLLKFLELKESNELFYIHNQIEPMNKILDELIDGTYSGMIKWRTHKVEYIGTNQMSTRDFDFGIYKRDYLLFQPYSNLSITYIPFGTGRFTKTELVEAGFDKEIDQKILQLVNLAYSLNKSGIKREIIDMSYVVARRFDY